MLRLIILTLLLCPLVPAWDAQEAPSSQPAQSLRSGEDFSSATPAPVVEVRDADLIVVEARRGRFVAQLFGVQSRRGESGAASRRFLEHLLIGEQVYLKYERPAHAESVPRRAYVFRAPDGLFVNAELIRQGYATMDAGVDSRYRDQFEACERRARAAAKGVWSILAAPDAPATQPAAPPAATAPAASRPVVGESGSAEQSASTDGAVKQMVYVTKSGVKYHRATCSFAKKGATAIPLQEALKQKLTPCTRCRP